MNSLDKVVLNRLQSFLPIEDRMKPLNKKWVTIYREDPFYKNRTSYPMTKHTRDCYKGLEWAIFYNRIDWIIYFSRFSGPLYWHSGLFGAIERGNIPLMHFFMEKGAQINMFTFSTALRGNRLDIIQIVMDHIGIENIALHDPFGFYINVRYKCMFDFLEGIYNKVILMSKYNPEWHLRLKYFKSKYYLTC